MTEMDRFTPRCRRQLARLYSNDSAATAIEYAMIASAVGGVLAATVFSLGGTVNNLYTLVSGLFG
jgi:Flp pilus assembly pilin Flp